MPRSPQPIVIRRRWWAHLIVALVTPVLAVIAGFAILGFSQALARQQWIAVAFLPVMIGVFASVIILALNSLVFYRVEIDRDGMRIVGNIYTHQLMWSEIVSIRPRHNFRIPGYHVEIQVDGSRNPCRHWTNFWFAGYFITPFMQRGGKDLCRYLQRKQNEWRRRTLANDEEE